MGMTRRGLLLFVAMSLILGIPYLFIRIAVSEITPAMLVFLRTVVAALVLMPLAVRRGGFRDLFDKWRPLVMFALIEIGIPWLSISTAEQQISSSRAGLLISAVPLVGVVIAPVFGSREKIGPLNLAGLLLGLVGVAAIVGLDLRATGWVPLVEVAVVVVCYATGPAILSRYLSGLPAVSVNAAALALCALLYAPAGLVPVAANNPEHRSIGIGGRARAGLQRPRVPHLLLAHRRDPTRPRHGDH